MSFLVRKNKVAAGTQDSLGKCPIHYVAEFYPCYDNKSDIFGMLEVIRILGDVAPQSFNLEDNSGRNAIEYAIETDAHIETIKAIQRGAIAHEKSTKDTECTGNKDDEVIVHRPRMPARMATFLSRSATKLLSQ